MRSTPFVTGLAAISFGSRLASAQCLVYGIDIQNGGTYFENAELTVPFTLVQEFSGCQNDTANVGISSHDYSNSSNFVCRTFSSTRMATNPNAQTYVLLIKNQLDYLPTLFIDSPDP